MPYTVVFVVSARGLSTLYYKMNLYSPEQASDVARSLRRSCRVSVRDPRVRYLDREVTSGTVRRSDRYIVIDVSCPTRQHFTDAKSVLKGVRRRSKATTRPGQMKNPRRPRLTARSARNPHPRLAHKPRRR